LKFSVGYFRWPPRMRNAFIAGCVCGLLLVLNPPMMLIRAWQAYDSGKRVEGRSARFWIGGAAANGAVGAAGLYWARRRWQRERAGMRMSSGLCPICGYSLQATPGRWPECGTIPAAAPAK
jgi:hypothetical protein